MKKLGYIDATRGLAILGVLMVHCAALEIVKHTAIVTSILINGAKGVQLFFVASAFTLFLSLDQRIRVEERIFAKFFIRRFFRIAPMYYLGIAYYLFQDGFGPRYWLGHQPCITNWNVASNFFFLHGFHPYWINSLVPGGWSIAVEVLFYCLVPFLFNKIKNLNQAVALFVVANVLKVSMQFALIHVHPIPESDIWNAYLLLYLPGQLPVFACGIVLYFLVKTEIKNFYVSPWVLLSIALLAIGQLATGLPVFSELVIFSAFFSVLVYAMSQRKFILLDNAIVRYIGKISYSLYLVHFGVLHWMKQINLVNILPEHLNFLHLANYIIRYVFLLAFSVLLSSIFYKLIESPFQNLGRKLIKKLDQKSKQLSAVTT